MITLEAWQLGVYTVLSSGVGAYLASYLKKKGENLATHEDFQQLIGELKATTEATKAIEGRISDEFWNRQRVWELKRDILLEVITNLGAIDDSLIALSSLEKTKRLFPNEKEIANAKSTELNEIWFAAARKLMSSRHRASVICSAKTNQIVISAWAELAEIQGSFRNGSDYGDVVERVQLILTGVADAIRTELMTR